MTLTRRPAGWAGARFPAFGASLLFVIFGATGIWFFAFFVPAQRQAAVDGWRRDLSARAEIRRDALQRFFTDGVADAESFALYPTARRLLSPGSAGAPTGAAGADEQAGHLQEVFNGYVRSHGIAGVVLWDARANVAVKSRDIAVDDDCAAPARDVIASGAPAMGFHRHEGVGPLLTFSAPVRSPDGGVLGAVIIAEDPRKWLYPLLSQPLAGTASGESLLVGRDGSDALYLSPLRGRPDLPLSFRRPLDDPEFAARKALEGSESVGSFVDYQGVRVLATGRLIPPSPWALVVKIDEVEMLADVNVEIRRTGLALAGALVASLLLAWGLWQKRERAKARALVESEKRFRSLFEGMLDGYAYCEMLYEGGRPHDFVYLEINSAFERLTGLKGVVGRKVSDVIPGIRVSSPELIETYGRVASSGTPERFEIYIDALGIWFSISAYSPRKGHFVAVFDNITERRQAETVLKESEARYRTLLENIPQQIFMKSRTFRYVSVNENYARDLGVRPAEAIGKVDYDLFPREIADKYRADDERVMETAQSEEFEEPYVQGGREKWIHTIKTPVRDRDGEVIGVLGVFWDITERKRAEEALRTSEANFRGLTEELESRVETRTAELEAANREMEAFSYSVSHDLRAPLRAMDGFSRILIEDHEKQLDGEGKRLLGVIRTNTVQMANLIDDLLAFSRIGRQEMARTEVDMAALAKAAFAELAPAGEGVSFKVGALPRAAADLSLMRQVFLNLISNALKFTGPKAQRAVEVGARTEPDRVVYWVKDNGVGFDMAYANKLFGVFQRLHSAAEFEGTGVGLALVRRIINRHGGEVWAEGKVGEGATFSFSLPILPVKGGL